MKISRNLLPVATLLCLLSTSAEAAMTATVMTVSTSTSTSCIISTTPLAFGNYDPVVANKTSPLNKSGTVSITCSGHDNSNHDDDDDNITIGLGDGLHFASGTRNMAKGSELLPYFLYMPSSSTPGATCNYSSPIPWGNSGSSLFKVTSIQDGKKTTYNICGQIPAGKNVSVGDYTDTVVATVNF